MFDCCYRKHVYSVLIILITYDLWIIHTKLLSAINILWKWLYSLTSVIGVTVSAGGRYPPVPHFLRERLGNWREPLSCPKEYVLQISSCSLKRCGGGTSLAARCTGIQENITWLDTALSLVNDRGTRTHRHLIKTHGCVRPYPCSSKEATTPYANQKYRTLTKIGKHTVTAYGTNNRLFWP